MVSALRNMHLRTNSYDADLPILAYLMVLATIAAMLGFSLYGLWKPYSSPNPGLSAYQAPTGLFVTRVSPMDGESGGLVAQLAAAESRVAAAEGASGQEAIKPKRA